MTVDELNRTIERIEALKRPPDWLRGIAFTGVGVFVSLLTAGITADSGSSAAFVFFVVSVASLVVSIAFFVADWQLGMSAEKEQTSIVARLRKLAQMEPIKVDENGVPVEFSTVAD